ncbi:MAG TPA: RimK family alpha-L-glutamate ligase [Polyangiaceae bacterium]|nr:RimK family alpha-L-glutamate ligase [Polyangiaceae bacterium]
MKIAILSREPRSYTTEKLRKTARDRGHRVRILDPTLFSVFLDESGPRIFYGEEPAPEMDAVIPRIGASITHYGTTVVRQFEQMGTLVLNTSNAILDSRDKFRSLQILSRHKIGIPATTLVRGRGDTVHAIERVGGAPVIIKVLEGAQGVGVILAETEAMAKAVLETLTARQAVLVQSFVRESRGRDVRALVVNGKLIAAMRRVASEREFRSNLHRGGRAEAIELPPAYQKTAVAAAQVLGLRVAGVDMLESDEGPKVIEVNSSPGLEGIESATGIDCAAAIIAACEYEAPFPQFDLRQRLTATHGFAVVEMRITRTSGMVGKELGATEFRANNVVVLQLTRAGGEVETNPPADRKLRPGDRLLCYGPTGTLRELLPVRWRRLIPKEKRPGQDNGGDGLSPAPAEVDELSPAPADAVDVEPMSTREVLGAVRETV